MYIICIYMLFYDILYIRYSTLYMILYILYIIYDILYPPAPRRGATRLRGISSIFLLLPLFLWEHVTALIFRIFVISILLFRILAFLHVSWCILHVELLLETVWRMTMGPRDNTKYHPRQGALPSGTPPESHRKSWNFKPGPRPPKVIKNGPKAIENHVKMTPKST